ncbi:MAG: dihydrofolate reductase family protein [Solirubrobacteraceae bacterium]
MDFRQLLPEHRTVELENLTASLGLAARAPDERPYTLANFVASVDGRATFGGRSGALGDDGDRAMFHSLRGAVDAVMAGTVTMRTERYRRMIADADRRRRRVEAGLAPEPLAVIVTRSGDVPADIPLFDEPEARVAVFTATDVDLAGARAQVDVVRLDSGELTFVTVMRQLRAEHGVRSLLCEGGPTLFGALVREGVVDELFLTLAAKLTGGGRGPTISSGPELPEPAPLRLIWALERAGSLYLRYGLS